ncbi:MAG: carboxypeptidase-like regulatory domain-containing protein [Planctomycetota bacterium]
MQVERERKAEPRDRGARGRSRRAGWIAAAACAATLAVLAYRADEPAAPATATDRINESAPTQPPADARDVRSTDPRASSDRRDVAEPVMLRAPRIVFVEHGTGLPAAHLAVRFVPDEGDLDREEDFWALLARLAPAPQNATWLTDASGTVAPDLWPAERCLAQCVDEYRYVVDGELIAGGQDVRDAKLHVVEVTTGYAIRGIVRDANGEAVAGARVFASIGRFATLFGSRVAGSPDPLSPASWRIAMTDERGAFLLPGIPVHDALRPTLVATAPGHASAILKEPPQGVAGQTVIATLTCQPGTTLLVRVVADDSSIAVPGAVVALQPEPEVGFRPRPVGTDQDGKAKFADLGEGPHMLEVEANGFVKPKQRVLVEQDGAEVEVRLVRRPGGASSRRVR